MKTVEKGPTVHLRRPANGDAPGFLARVHASRALHRPWVEPPADRDAYRALLVRAAGEDFEAFLICRTGDGELVGVADLSRIFHGGFKNAYLGFYAFSPHERRGYMTEGVGLVLRHAFRTLKLHRLEANVQPKNERSEALLSRLGFRREGFSPRYLKIGGRWRDHNRWAILEEEWRRGRPLAVQAQGGSRSSSRLPQGSKA